MIEAVLSTGDGREQPIEVVLIDAWWKESDNSEEFSGTGSEVEGRGGGTSLWNIEEVTRLLGVREGEGEGEGRIWRPNRGEEEKGYASIPTSRMGG